MTKTYAVRLNTPGVQYWVSSFDIYSEDLTLTNVTKDAALFDRVDIPFIERVINETFADGCIVEAVGEDE